VQEERIRVQEKLVVWEWKFVGH